SASVSATAGVRAAAGSATSFNNPKPTDGIPCVPARSHGAPSSAGRGLDPFFARSWRIKQPEHSSSGCVMADATTKRLLTLLAPEHAAEVRSAAAVVLGEVASKDTETAKALLASLDDPDPAVRSQAI